MQSFKDNTKVDSITKIKEGQYPIITFTTVIVIMVTIFTLGI